MIDAEQPALVCEGDLKGGRPVPTQPVGRVPGASGTATLQGVLQRLHVLQLQDVEVFITVVIIIVFLLPSDQPVGWRPEEVDLKDKG